MRTRTYTPEEDLPPVSLSGLRATALAIARDATPAEQLALILGSVQTLTGGARVSMVVRPTRLAQVCGVTLRQDPVEIAPGIWFLGSGDLADRICRAEGGAPTGDGELLILPTPQGGLAVHHPHPQTLLDPQRVAVLESLAALAAGALHTARRVDESRQRATALEAARTRLHEQNQLLQELAVVDELTGLHNRRSFQQRLEDEIRRLHRYGRPLALAIFDVDFFKQVNDTAGHAAGDAVLRFVADCARRAARKVDLVSRFGGDEFAILMPETDAAGGAVVAERLRSLLLGMRPTEVSGLRFSVSVGVVGVHPGWPGDAAALYKAADEALYQSKQGGRDRVTAVERG